MKQVKKIAVIGTGVIGASWTAFFLYQGFTVNAYDPAPNAEQNLRSRVTTYLQDLFELAHVTANTADVEQLLAQLSFKHDIAAAVCDADFIQENGPERLDIKKSKGMLQIACNRHCGEKHFIWFQKAYVVLRILILPLPMDQVCVGRFMGLI